MVWMFCLSQSFCSSCIRGIFFNFAWLLANPCVCSVIAGATTPEQVTANAATVGWHLSDEEMAEVDEILS
ncbi:MAG: aldo/keto reductase [Candidatus Latescibacteria bacterium]|nr:aldo/keto reductase [Candidatus Latescibacterota bacterium]